MVASGYGVTLLPEVAIDVQVRDKHVKLLRFVEPQPQRSVGLAWRPTSTRKAGFLGALSRFCSRRSARSMPPLSRGPLTVGSFRTALSLS